jgi:hypothetical protein
MLVVDERVMFTRGLSFRNLQTPDTWSVAVREVKNGVERLYAVIYSDVSEEAVLKEANHMAFWLRKGCPQ